MKETAEVRLTVPDDQATFTLVGPPEDRGVIGEIQHSGGTYAPQLMRFLRRIVRNDAVVFDVGANIGVFALVLGRLADRGRVFAFEPAQENFDYLARNIATNGASNVVAERCAIYDRSGNVPFVFTAAGPSASFVSQNPEHAAESQPVNAVTLDDYVETQGLRRLDLIMVDAEGAEMAVLRGAARTLRTYRPALLIEVNPVSLRRFGGATFRDLAAEIRKGWSLYSITHEGLPARVFSDLHLELLLRLEGLVDLLCLPKGHYARTVTTSLRGLRQRAALRQAFRRGPPENNFVVEPAFVITAPPGPVQGLPDHIVWLTVEVRNSSPYWYSSDFVYHPVHLCYRWFTEDGSQLEVLANRGRFESPLGPGAAGTVRIPVRLPPEPGEYRLALTLLQESYAWFDDLDPSLRLFLTGIAKP